ncbi:MAG: patatin-like phospholipase family protein [Campylobacterales bacterium]|nr:patatin-like phospholipase family protein [Campylobacterales bacterium]
MRLLPQLLLFWFLFSSLSFAQDQDKDPVDLSMVISGGVSLGAYEAGYNWAMIKMLTHIKHHGQYVDPHMRSVTGASAGSINALLSAVYWCQEDTNATKNQITNNLFYDTWVKLGLEDLIIKGDTEPDNKSSLFTRKVLTEKADAILTHMSQPIFSQGCEVPMGFSVTKAKPMTITLSNSDIEIKNQHFSVPLTLRESNGRLTIENRMIENSQDHLIHIPDIENNITKAREVLFASSAFPGAFEQVKLDYRYNGVNYSSYFIDGGAYDNLPLLLAQELSQYNKLDPKRRYFVVIDPDNIRPKPVEGSTVEPENKPVGFLNANTLPLFNAVNISAITPTIGSSSLPAIIR